MALRLQGIIPNGWYSYPQFLGWCPIDVYDGTTRATRWLKEAADEVNAEAMRKHRKQLVARILEEYETGPDTGTDIPAHRDWQYQCAWLTPKGRWIGVEYGGHDAKLQELFKGQVTYSEIEYAGWVHVGGCNDRDCPRYDGNPLSAAQISKLRKFGYNPERRGELRYA